jgi:Tol biopolymer transport system component/C-terminal processing protease CtpA/Prc
MNLPFLRCAGALAVVLIFTRVLVAADIAPTPTFTDPASSPDGSEIAFVHADDIWVVPSAGGTAHLLVSHPAAESRPIYSPDGTKLAFVSTRDGSSQIYVLTFATGDVARLTYDDGANQLDGWSRDGKWIYFTSSSADLGGSNGDIYRIRATGGTPMAVSEERYTNEFDAAPSPDGKTLALCAAASSRDWWRNGHTNWNESHIFLRHERKDRPATYDELTKAGVRELWPMWSKDSKTLFCVSDAAKQPQNIVSYDLAAKGTRVPKPLTSFKDGRVLWPSISYDGKTILFERDFGIWKVSSAGGEPEQIKITLRGAPAVETSSAMNYIGGFKDLSLSPDGRKLAFAVHGEIFAVSAREGGRAVRVTNTACYEGQVAWHPDSQRIAYVSQRGGAQNIYLYDFASQTETPLTHADAVDSTPRFSPDGLHLLFRRNGVELRLLELKTKKDRLLTTCQSAALPPFDDATSPYCFSPKSQWVAYIDSGKRGYDNVYVVSTVDKDAKPKQVTFFANTGSNTISWTSDGRSLFFGTGMRTEDYQLARVDLVNRAPNFSEDQFRGLFEEEMRSNRPGSPKPVRPQPSPGPATQPADPKPLMTPSKNDAAGPTLPKQPSTQPTTFPSDLRSLFPSLAPEKFNFDNLRQHTSLLSVGADVDQQIVTPDGKWCVFLGGSGGKTNVYAYPLDGSGGGDSGVRQLTSTTGGKSNLCCAPDSREIYFLEAGKIHAVTLDRQIRDINVSCSMEVEFSQEKLEVFHQAWNYLKLNFYDAKMHGNDWEAIRKRYEPFAAGAKTSAELRRVLALMIGELNASHLGVSSGNRTSATIGRLGLRFDRAAYEKSGLLKVTEVLTGGPGDQAGIKVGDSVFAVDGNVIDEHTNLQKLLERKIGHRVLLRVKSEGKGASEREVPIRPVDMATEKTLLYRDWTEKNRAYVAKISNGRLGYVHIADMSQKALARLIMDLDAENATRDGVVIDIRSNTGGFVSPYVLDVLSRKNYLTMTRRGATDSPGRMYVGQRALDLPTILVTNHQSISDAEDFSEGYRALKLGKVVGEPTAGGVIFTSDINLLDGTVFRIPFSKVTALRDGKSLEEEARPVDIKVHRPLGETPQGKDSQLEAAARELLKQIDKAAAIAKGKPDPTKPATRPAATVGAK